MLGNPSSQAKLTGLLMVRTNTYNDQVIRPFATNMSSNMVDSMREATQYGECITAASLAGVAGTFLRPQAQAAAGVDMYNGWDQTRLRFMLSITIPMGNGGYVHEIVTGYTDFYGTSADGQHIDPNMRMFFNNTVVLNSSQVSVGGMGMQNQVRVSEATHLLMPPPGYSNGSSIDTHTMRPEDILNAISTSAITDGTRLDMRTNFSMSPVKKSYRTNGLAPNYLARTMNAVDQALRIDQNLQQTQLYSEARGLVKEPMLSQDLFIKIISMSTQFKERGFLTYGELCAVFPNTDHIRTMIMPREAMRVGSAIPGRGASEYWHVPTNETVIATILTHAVPALMMELMLTKLTFTATNMTLNGQPEIQFHDSRGFIDGMDMTQYVQRFMQRFVSEVMADITHNNMFQINLAMTCNILGDTMITLSISGGPNVDYVSPSFCDALFSPLVTTDLMSFQTMAHDLDCLNNNLTATRPMQGNSNMHGFDSSFQSMTPSMGYNTQPQGDNNVSSQFISSI